MNRLRDATSPYLLQHADNPVDWYPWGEAALARARDENKPILLSIGYSACHWCHVMAHESFEDATIAALMNRLFINIKVDREERPDLDKIYQAAHQLLTGSNGGWPLTMFLTPADQVPYFGGTYFPNVPRYGRPSFSELLKRVAGIYAKNGAQMAAFKDDMRAALATHLGGTQDQAASFEPALMGKAAQQLVQSFDDQHGGLGRAPKFPHPQALALLLVSDPERVEFTLRAMAAGGLFDHVGGGFFRYSTDDSWTIPHFEKMLYDNAALLSHYSEVGASRGRADLCVIASAIATWLQTEMQDAAGGFHASIDADAAGEEGSYYVWSQAQVASLLGDTYPEFAQCYGLNAPANFEGHWHLRRQAPAPAAALPAVSAPLQEALQILYAARSQRSAPAHDDKILTAWNALTIRALARSGRLLARPGDIVSASRALDFLVAHHWRDGRLLATSRGGVASLTAYLDDYAFLLCAVLELLACRWRRADLDFALALAEVLLAEFEDVQHGGFYFTAHSHEQLLVRVRSFSDDALPSGNVLAAQGLLELSHLVGEMRYRDAAMRALSAATQAAQTASHSHASALLANHVVAADPAYVILRGEDEQQLSAWCQLIAAQLGPAVRCQIIPSSAENLPGLLAARRPAPNAPVTAYVCRGQHCSAPATTPEALLLALGH